MLRKQALTVIPDGRKGQQYTKDSDKFVKSIHRQSRSHRCSCTAAVIMILNEGVDIQKITQTMILCYFHTQLIKTVSLN